MVGWLPFIVPTCPEVGRASRLQDLLDAGSGPLVVRPLPFGRSPALLVVCWLEICLYLAFTGFLTGF